VPVWTGVGNLALTGIRSPDRPACSESLYRLSYRGCTRRVVQQIFISILNKPTAYFVKVDEEIEDGDSRFCSNAINKTAQLNTQPTSITGIEINNCLIIALI